MNAFECYLQYYGKRDVRSEKFKLKIRPCYFQIKSYLDEKISDCFRTLVKFENYYFPLTVNKHPQNICM